MRVLLISDLHIKPESRAEDLPWVSRFCQYVSSQCDPETYVFVLGDIVDKGGINRKEAFDAARIIFTRISETLSSIYCPIAFLPGNHDYCDGNLEEFTAFSKQFQTFGDVFDFRKEKVWSAAAGCWNFIFADSVTEGNYSRPGTLDLQGIRKNIRDDKKNLLLLHHSLVFEDASSHTGITNQPEAVKFLTENRIEFVFHGHAHATRNHHPGPLVKQYGVGSLGLDTSELSGLQNEQEQFFEASFMDETLETIQNWIWRGGAGNYRPTYIYPDLPEYADGSQIKRLEYRKPEKYIARQVLARNSADADSQYTAKTTTLGDACRQGRHVLLIADAGLGKTIELEYLAYWLTEMDSFHRPVLLTLSMYDGEPLQTYIDNLVPEYLTLNHSRLFLILDGYDELARPDAFRRELSQYILSNPRTHICISMRSNFLPSVSSAFQNFKIYQLMPLTQKDIAEQLRSQGVDERHFMEECNMNRLRDLTSNPFYLEKLIAIYIQDGVLPSQRNLMKRFVEEQFQIDSVKFEYAGSSTLAEHQYEIARALRRFALGMQLLNRTSCGEETYQSLLDEDDRDRLKRSSFTIKRQSEHSFAHNIFREYYVAEHLVSLNIEDTKKLIFFPETNAFDPNWFNAVGLALQSESSQALIELIASSEPILLTRLEPIQVSEDLRYNVLSGFLTKIETENTWFEGGANEAAQLAGFSQSPRALELLMNHICRPVHFRALYFCLTVLSHFSELFGKEKEVREMLRTCYQDPAVRDHERRVAIAAIAMLHLEAQEITSDILTRFTSTQSSFVRMGIYNYLYYAQKINEHAEFLLSCVEHISFHRRRGVEFDVSEVVLLRKCLKQLNQADSLETAIRWYTCSSNRNLAFYDCREVFSAYFSRAASLYKEGHTKLFDAVCAFAVDSARCGSGHHMRDAVGFFCDTDTLEAAFGTIAGLNVYGCEIWCFGMIQMKPELLDLFIRLYEADKLGNSFLFQRYALRANCPPEIFEKCAEIIRRKTGQVLQAPPAPVDYEKRWRDDTQIFFDCLFNRAEMEKLMDRLVTAYGDITCKQLVNADRTKEDFSGTSELTTAIVLCLPDEAHITDFLKCQPWNVLRTEQLCRILSNENKNAAIQISDGQKKELLQIYSWLESNINFHTAYESNDDGHSLSGSLPYYLILKGALDLPSPKEVYLGFLEIPYFFFCGLADEGAKYSIIEGCAPQGEIAARIEELISVEDRKQLLSELLFGFNRYGVCDEIAKEIAKEIALQLCVENGESAADCSNAVEYLLEYDAEDAACKTFLSEVDNSVLLLLAQKLPVDQSSDLKSELYDRYECSKDEELLKVMLQLQMPEALTAYLNMSKEQGCIIDKNHSVEEITETIGHITDVKLLPLLLNGVRLCFTDGFDDGAFHTLSGALFNALTACAKTDFDSVRSAVCSLKAELAACPEAIGFCSRLQNSIEDIEHFTHRKVWTIQEIRTVLKSLK